MSELESTRYEKVISEGRKAVSALKENKIEEFLRHAEAGWELFPAPRHSWTQSYNYAKMVFKGAIDKKKFNETKIWLERMVQNNDLLKLSEGEVQFLEGKYYFETGDYKKAYEKFKYAVVDAEAGFRYFEDEDPKYLKFYQNPEKHLSK